MLISCSAPGCHFCASSGLVATKPCADLACQWVVHCQATMGDRSVFYHIGLVFSRETYLSAFKNSLKNWSLFPWQQVCWRCPGGRNDCRVCMAYPGAGSCHLLPGWPHVLLLHQPAFMSSSCSPCQPVGEGNWIFGVVSIWFSGTQHLQQFSSVYSQVWGSRAQEFGKAD